MKYYHDAEFATERVSVRVHSRQPGSPGPNKKITPISYAIVCEDGRQACWTLRHDDDYAKVTVPWLIENVYPWLPTKTEWVTLKDAANGLLSFFGDDRDIQLYAYSNSGQPDLFVMRLLFDDKVPEWLPTQSINLRHLARDLGVPKTSVPYPERRHDALADALWDKALHELLERVEGERA